MSHDPDLDLALALSLSENEEALQHHQHGQHGHHSANPTVLRPPHGVPVAVDGIQMHPSALGQPTTGAHSTHSHAAPRSSHGSHASASSTHHGSSSAGLSHAAASKAHGSSAPAPAPAAEHKHDGRSSSGDTGDSTSGSGSGSKGFMNRLGQMVKGHGYKKTKDAKGGGLSGLQIDSSLNAYDGGSGSGGVDTDTDACLAMLAEEEERRKEQCALDEAMALSLQEQEGNEGIGAAARATAGAIPPRPATGSFDGVAPSPRSFLAGSSPLGGPPKTQLRKLVARGKSTASYTPKSRQVVRSNFDAGIEANENNCCFGCHQPLGFGHILTAMRTRKYHPGCFVCEGCGAPFGPKEGFVATGSPVAPYHASCARTLFSPQCCLCTAPLAGQKYNLHAYFRQPEEGGGGYCSSHQRTQGACFSCNRLEPVTAGSVSGSTSSTSATGEKFASHKEPFIKYPDGRLSCPDCISTAILDSSEARDIYLEILTFLREDLGLTLPPGMEEVPILAVDLSALNEQISGQQRYAHGVVSSSGKKVQSTAVAETPNSGAGSSSSFALIGDRRHNESMYNFTAADFEFSDDEKEAEAGSQDRYASTAPMTRGLTISSRGVVHHYVIPQQSEVESTGKMDLFGRLVFNMPTVAYSLGMTDRFKLEEHETRSVTAILVLFGLPRDLTASIIAHEAMHAFCKLTADMPFHMAAKVEEGMCQYVAHRYLQYVEAVQNTDAGPPGSTTHSALCDTDTPTTAGSKKFFKVGHGKARSGSIASGAGTPKSVSRTNSFSSDTWSTKWNRLLVKYYKLQIETNPSVTYGDGYRESAQCAETLGLDILLEQVKYDPNKFPQC